MLDISFWQVIELPQEAIWLHDGRCHGAVPVHVFMRFNVRPFWASLNSLAIGISAPMSYISFWQATESDLQGNC